MSKSTSTESKRQPPASAKAPRDLTFLGLVHRNSTGSYICMRRCYQPQVAYPNDLSSFFGRPSAWRSENRLIVRDRGGREVYSVDLPLDKNKALRLARPLFPLIKTDRLTLQQERLSEVLDLDQLKGSFLLFWQMGTGKTRAALQSVLCNSNCRTCVVVCPHSVISVWKNELMRVDCQRDIMFHVVGYDAILRSTSVFPAADVLILDECHNFRNVTPERQQMIRWILKVPRRLLLSGTPIVNSGADTQGLLALFGAPPTADLATVLRGRVHFFDPAFLEKAKAESDKDVYPKVIYHETRTVPMTPLQYFTYRMTQQGKIEFDGYTVQQGMRNCYNTLSSLYCNYLDDDNAPKLDTIVRDVVSRKEWPVVIFSRFLDKGVFYLEKVFNAKGITTAILTGATALDERNRLVQQYNKGSIQVFLFSSAGDEGISLFRTRHFILTEPGENRKQEEQAIRRAVRAHSHKGVEDKVVNVWVYVATFPRTLRDSDWQAMGEVLRDRYLPRDVSSSEAKKLVLKTFTKRLKEDPQTADERTLARNRDKDRDVELTTNTLRKLGEDAVLAERVRRNKTRVQMEQEAMRAATAASKPSASAPKPSASAPKPVPNVRPVANAKPASKSVINAKPAPNAKPLTKPRKTKVAIGG